MLLRGQAQDICCQHINHPQILEKELQPAEASVLGSLTPGRRNAEESAIPQLWLRFPAGWHRLQRKASDRDPQRGKLFTKQPYIVLGVTLATLHFLLRISWPFQSLHFKLCSHPKDVVLA